MCCVSWSWCGRGLLRRVVLRLLLYPLAKIGGGLVNAIYEQSYYGEVFGSVDVCIDQHESVNASKVVGVQSEDLAHGAFDNWAAAVMFYAVLGGVTALEKANVVRCVSLLISSGGVPFIPYCAEDSGPDPWCNGLLQLCK